MLSLRVLVPPPRTGEVVATLEGLTGVVNVLIGGVTHDGSEQVITADVAPRSADEMFNRLERLDIDLDAITLLRQVTVGPVARRRAGGWFSSGSEALVWAEAVDTARENATLTTRYCLYMAVAGVIATYGIILRNPILIIGAMAVSPDLLPLTAFSIGVVGRRPRLASRSLAVLVIGLATAALTSTALAWLLRHFGAYNGLLSSADALSGIVRGVSSATVAIALAAGVAGMLAFQTRASAAVGVAISVTTIPAVAFAGVAVGIGDVVSAVAALEVLAINVLMLFIGGVLTLSVQRRYGRRYH